MLGLWRDPVILTRWPYSVLGRSEERHGTPTCFVRPSQFSFLLNVGQPSRRPQVSLASAEQRSRAFKSPFAGLSRILRAPSRSGAADAEC